MKFDNVISAIKTLRAIPRGTIGVSVVGGIPQVVVDGGGLGLKEAKDIVEACMALGVERYKADVKNNGTKEIIREFLKAELAKLDMGSCNQCGKAQDRLAIQPCDDCYNARQRPVNENVYDDIKF